MATLYPGFQTYVSTAPSPTSPYGRFVAGNATDDGDLDDAAHLMALVMAATDSIQWLGWRVGYLNVVEGSTGNPALTATIRTYNNWVFSGIIDFASTVSFDIGPVLMNAAMTVTKTMTIGNTSFDASVVVTGGSDITMNAGSTLLIDGFAVLGTAQPAKGADPGANNLLYSTNTTKAWGSFTSDGSGGLTYDDGYNIGSAAIVSGKLVITFARHLANANYCVTSGSVDISTTAVYTQCVARSTTALTIAVWALDNPSAPFDISANLAQIQIMVHVIGRQ